MRWLAGGTWWIKLPGPYRILNSKPLSSAMPIGKANLAARRDRLIWGSDWPRLPGGRRDTGELANLITDCAPHTADRKAMFGDGSESSSPPINPVS